MAIYIILSCDFKVTKYFNVLTEKEVGFMIAEANVPHLAVAHS
jgi:hypothetical protein